MGWIVTLFNKLISFLYSMYLGIGEILKDFWYFILESCLSMIDVAVNLISALLSPVDLSHSFPSIPPNVAWIFSVLGLPQALLLIGTSLMIRIVLQLIPFTRLGS